MCVTVFLPREGGNPSHVTPVLFPAVDRSVSATLSDARDALVNAVIDSLAAYRSSVLSIQQPGLTAPFSLRLFPLYILALLKQVRGEREPGNGMVVWQVRLKQKDSYLMENDLA